MLLLPIPNKAWQTLLIPKQSKVLLFRKMLFSLQRTDFFWLGTISKHTWTMMVKDESSIFFILKRGEWWWKMPQTLCFQARCATGMLAQTLHLLCEFLANISYGSYCIAVFFALLQPSLAASTSLLQLSGNYSKLASCSVLPSPFDYF